MPANMVKPGQEPQWEKAKKLAADRDRGDDYAYIVGIFKRLTGDDSGSARKALAAPRVSLHAGAGSRGGRVIGKTRSGAPIYAHGVKAAATYSKQDHKDAASVHDNFAHLTDGEEKKHHQHMAGYHAHRAGVDKSLKESSVSDIIKGVGGKGAGSRGGKVIGTTKSGKPIYAAAGEGAHPAYTKHLAVGKTDAQSGRGIHGSFKGWSKEDHADAAMAHDKEARDQAAEGKVGHGSESYQSAKAGNAHRKAYGHAIDAVRKERVAAHPNGVGKTASGKVVPHPEHEAYFHSGYTDTGGKQVAKRMKGWSSNDHHDAANLHANEGNQSAAISHRNAAKHLEKVGKSMSSVWKSIPCPECERHIPTQYAIKSLASLAKSQGMELKGTMADLVKGKGSGALVCPHCAEGLSKSYVIKGLSIASKQLGGDDIAPALEAMFKKPLAKSETAAPIQTPTPQPANGLFFVAPSDSVGLPNASDIAIAAAIKKNNGFLGQQSQPSHHLPQNNLLSMIQPNQILGGDQPN